MLSLRRSRHVDNERKVKVEKIMKKCRKLLDSSSSEDHFKENIFEDEDLEKTDAAADDVDVTIFRKYRKSILYLTQYFYLF